MNDSDSLNRQLTRVERSALAAGLLCAAVCAVAGWFDSTQFFRSYLVAYLFWIGLPLGCLAIVMIHHLAGGRWGFGVRRLLEAGTRTLLLMAVLFIPLLFGLQSLYVWARPEAVAASEMLRHKQPYLNVPFFIVRAALYFAVWLGLAWRLDRAAADQDRAPSLGVTQRLTALGGGGLVAYGVTMSFAAIDWAMSLEPEWFSTVYGVLLMTGQVLGGFALVIVVATALAKQKPLADAVSAQQFHDLGNFMFTFVIFWAYISFAQYLIIWAGNLPEENSWYLRRFEGGWSGVGIFLMVFHFFAPFVLLLSRDIKRRPGRLAAVAVGVLAVCVVDLFWIVKPAFDRSRFGVHWMDVVALLGIGGLWVAAFVGQLKGRSLVPVHDARVEEELQWT